MMLNELRIKGRENDRSEVLGILKNKGRSKQDYGRVLEIFCDTEARQKTKILAEYHKDIGLKLIERNSGGILKDELIHFSRTLVDRNF